MEKLRTAVFISGRGSNLQNLIKSCCKKSFPARICLIISNNPNAKGLVYGKRAKIPVKIISQKNHKTQKNFEKIKISRGRVFLQKRGKLKRS